MKVCIPRRVAIVSLETPYFSDVESAKSWAKSHGVIGLMSDVDTAGKGEIAISNNSLNKMLSGSAMRKSVTPELHYAALARLRDIIRESFVAEMHPDYKKVDGVRKTTNEINPEVDVAVLYGCVSMMGVPFRAKTTLKLHRDVNHPTKAYSYEISNIEVLTGTAESVIQPNALTSMDVSILLNGVRDVNGKLLVKQDFAYGLNAARESLQAWLSEKSHIALVTDGAAYSLCGAEEFVDGILSACPNLKVTHLVVPSANPKVETVQPLLDSLSSDVDAFLAIGGGTTIDTTKLLNLAFTLGKSVSAVLQLKLEPPTLHPCFAIPTTAGTGAEATRFAVCYDGETKYSIDFEVLKPSEVALIPDFVATLPPYQKASTNFDAYAQAVESLWAKGATDESREYARRALSLIQEGDWCRASYWAGRAIDISRTTAAHALSYYLTSHYGVPHGAAVYMVFEYICRNNGYPEYVRKSARLQTLRQFAAERGLDWNTLVDEIISHVNLKRLSNNPSPITKETFLSSPLTFA